MEKLAVVKVAGVLDGGPCMWAESLGKVLVTHQTGPEGKRSQHVCD